MKTRLNTTIDEQLLSEAKKFAEKNQISLSQIIEDHFAAIVRKKPTKKSRLFDMIERLTPSEEIVEQSKSKEAFYESQKEKYGF